MRHRTLDTRHAHQPPGIRRSHGQAARHPTAIPPLRRHNRRTAAASTPCSHDARAAPDPITLAAATWLACGIVMLGLTPLPLHDATLGWSPAFWLLAAPAVALLARCVRRRQSWIRDA